MLASTSPSSLVRRRVAAGAARRIARGVYVLPGPEPGRSDDTWARIAGVQRRLTGHVFSHESAAFLHGLPLWRQSSRVHVYQPSSASSRSDRTVVRHTPLPPDEHVVDLLGTRATALARTVWDCATTMPPAGAFVVVDAALHAGLPRDELTLLATGAAGRRGAGRGRAVLDFADEGAESPPESVCRFRALLAGLPVPTTQIPVRTHTGNYWADLGWPEWRLLLEYDGRVKYPDSSAFMAEKRRHDSIVETGWRIVRLTAVDLRTQADFERRLREHVPAAAWPRARRRELTW